MRDTVHTQALAAEARQWLQGEPMLPLPGRGRTLERWRALAAMGAHDLCIAKVLEAHHDAVAIIAELGGSVPDDALLAVWAAEGPTATLQFDPESATVSGDKPWCSGAGMVDAALVTAGSPLGNGLYLLDTRMQLACDADIWPATGMARVPSATARFDAAPALPVGRPGAYLERAGFWHGGAGIAAVWFGAASALVDAMLARADGDLRQRLAGRAAMVMEPAAAVLRALAQRIDAQPQQSHQWDVVLARSVVERACTTVLDLAGRSLGPAPMCLDQAHARRWADLTVFLRQSHADRDWQWLGSCLKEGAAPWTL